MFSKAFAPACFLIGLSMLGWISFRALFQNGPAASLTTIWVLSLVSVAMIATGVWKWRRSNRIQPAAS